MEQKDTPSVSISLTCKDAGAALDFYTKAFSAQELYRMPTPDGGVAHAEFMIGNTRIYISDESEEWHAYAMKEGTMASCLFSIATENCDKAFAQAVEGGAHVLEEPDDKFWGVRSALIKDPFGYRWSLGQFIEEVSPEEMQKRAAELYGKA